jgi:hypothetical protein
VPINLQAGHHGSCWSIFNTNCCPFPLKETFQPNYHLYFNYIKLIKCNHQEIQKNYIKKLFESEKDHLEKSLKGFNSFKLMLDSTKRLSKPLPLKLSIWKAPKMKSKIFSRKSKFLPLLTLSFVPDILVATCSKASSGLLWSFAQVAAV